MAEVEVFQSQGLTLAAFDPLQLGIVVHPRSDGNVIPMSGREVVASNADVIAALDGPMFETCDSRSYATSQCADLDYEHIDRRSGISYASDPDKITRGIAISVMPDGSAVSSLGGDAPNGAIVSVQLYPALVFDGAPQAVSSSGSNDSILWRAALVVLADGRMAFAVGRFSMSGFASALVQVGAIIAGYTDGGGSALMLADGNAFGSTENRRVASWLVVRKRSSIQSTSALSYLIGLGLIATAGAFAYKPSRDRIFHFASSAARRLRRV